MPERALDCLFGGAVTDSRNGHIGYPTQLTLWTAEAGEACGLTRLLVKAGLSGPRSLAADPAATRLEWL